MAKPKLQEQYENELRAKLQAQLGLRNVMQVPQLEKIVLNMGVGDGASDAKVIESAVTQLTAIAGQKPVVCRARKSISNFKLRQGQPIGVKVTLRGRRMYEFLERLISVAIPRIRDFRGLNPNGFDSQGNYTLGIQEQLIFPEIAFDDIDKVRGLNVCMVFKNPSREGCRALCDALGMPFQKTTRRKQAAEAA